MGCAGSSPSKDDVKQPSKPADAARSTRFEEIDPQEQEARGSVVYQSKELQSGRFSEAKRRTQRSAVFDKERIGTCTRHGIAPLPGGQGAKAKINQDRGVVCWPFNGSTSEALFCVFDGHGKKGELVSEFCMKTIPGLLESDAAALAAEPAAYLTKQVIAMDAQLAASPIAKYAAVAGTTSTVVYLRGNTCWVACSGDSRAVLGQRKGGVISAKDLSRDHKADLPDEKARIVAKGGEVTPAGLNNRPPPARVWAARGGTGLAMSRSIGDLEMRAAGVIPDPDVTKTELVPAGESDTADGDVCLIVASDGVWEFIESDEAVAIVMSTSDATEACTTLVREAQQRWKVEEGTYRDDITAVVAMLPFLEDVDEAAAAAEGEGEEDGLIQLNSGCTGVARLSANKPESPSPKKAGDKAPAPAGEDHEDFAARRLSVANFSVDEDDEVEEGEEDEP